MEEMLRRNLRRFNRFCLEKRFRSKVKRKLMGYIRQIRYGSIDLSTVTLEDLHLSSERSERHDQSGGEELEYLLNTLDIKRGDAIVDMGSGKGGAIISMVEYPFSKIRGVEISPNLVEIARRNFLILGIENVEILCKDATEVRDLEEFNYFYFFNPFPEVIMSQVLKNIKESLIKKSRRITIIYMNPVWDQIFANDFTFNKIKEINYGHRRCYLYTNQLTEPYNPNLT